MSFPKYPKYKDSGVEWLGDVPEHWEISRLGFESWVRARLGWKGLKADEYVDDGFAFLSTPNIKEIEIDFENVNFIDQHRFDESPEIILREGDVLLAKDGSTLGTVNIVRTLPRPTTVNSSIAVITPNSRLAGVFLYYLFETSYMEHTIQRIKGGMGVPHLFQADLNKFYLPIPSHSEQNLIASFLDRETSKIDALVGEQRRLIELLKEKRQAVISHAVTKGLNPNAPLKPSGIEWLGDVPEHWEFGPLKRFWVVADCKHITVPFLEEGFPVASVMEVRGFELDLSQVLRTSQEFFRLLTDGGRQPQQGDVIYCRNTANTGTSAYVGTDEAIAIGQDVVLIKSRNQNGRFLNYVLHCGTMADQLETLMVGSTFKRINVAEIRMLFVTCPPIEEQNAVVQFLDKETRRLDALTAEAERAIELLQERRTALISAVVTGKIDVRDFFESETT